MQIRIIRPIHNNLTVGTVVVYGWSYDSCTCDESVPVEFGDSLVLEYSHH